MLLPRIDRAGTNRDAYWDPPDPPYMGGRQCMGSLFRPNRGRSKPALIWGADVAAADVGRPMWVAASPP